LSLPTPGESIRVNGPAFRFQRRGAVVRVLSPVDGEVVETGGVNRDYLLRVRPASACCDTRHLLSGWEVRPWVTREVERLQLALSSEGTHATLADGGVPVADVAARC